MKYNILINQLGVAKAGLAGKTDLADWAIIDYLQQWYFAERKKTIFVQERGINYVWLNYKHLIEEMPLLGIKDKDALSNRIKKLKQLGLIDTFQTADRTLYFILTPKCVEIIGFTTNGKRLSDGDGTDLSHHDRTGLSHGDGTAQTDHQSNIQPRNQKDTLTCINGVDARDGSSEQAVDAPDDEKPRKPFRSKLQEDLFDEFWRAYPRKRNKGQAERAWVKISPNAELFAKIMDGLARAKASFDWRKEDGRFIPYPATWLNAKGWEDEYEGDPGMFRRRSQEAQPAPAKPSKYAHIYANEKNAARSNGN